MTGMLYPLWSGRLLVSVRYIGLCLTIFIHIMMDRKYQLVAWTKNIADAEKARLYMIPSLEIQMLEPYLDEVGRCFQEQKRFSGHITESLARRFVKAYEHSAGFDFLTGRYGSGIRFLCKAALYCIGPDNRVRKALKHDYARLCGDVVELARKYSREDILLEDEPRRVLSCALAVAHDDDAAEYHYGG